MKKNMVVSSQNSVVSIFKKAPFVLLFILLTTDYCLPSTAFSADKSWNAQGDQADWFDDANWLPSGSPDDADDAKVDMRDASVDVGQAFDARSLTVGGKKASTVNISNFVAGDLAPATAEDEAVLVRRDGKLILKGSAGKITVKGSYKDSEEIIPEEPGFMLYVK